MELETPRMVYRAGGNVLLESGAYSTRIVEDQAELKAALAEGWHLDQYAARGAVEPVKAEDQTPLTRADLEAKAIDIGVDFDRRWGDKRLAQAIADKLSAAAGA